MFRLDEELKCVAYIYFEKNVMKLIVTIHSHRTTEKDTINCVEKMHHTRNPSVIVMGCCGIIT